MSRSVQTTNEADDLVLLLKGGSETARENLVHHLKMSQHAFRLVEMPAGLSVSASGDDAEILEFLEDFTSRIAAITDKEHVVLNCVLEGHTNKAIAMRLDVSQRLVELRKASLMKKLNVQSHTELVRQITRFETLKRYFFARTSRNAVRAD